MRVKGIVKEQRKMSETAMLAIRTLLVVHIALSLKKATSRAMLEMTPKMARRLHMEISV